MTTTKDLDLGHIGHIGGPFPEFLPPTSSHLKGKVGRLGTASLRVKAPWGRAVALHVTFLITAAYLHRDTEGPGWRLISPILAEFDLRDTRLPWKATSWLERIRVSVRGKTQAEAVASLVKKLGDAYAASADARTKPRQRKLAYLKQVVAPIFGGELDSRLKLLRSLEPGWDGQDAPQIRSRAIEEAVWILHEALRRGAPTPAVVPSPDGGVDLEWGLESGPELYIQISPDGLKPYLLVTKDEQGHEKESEGAVTDLQGLQELLLVVGG